MPDPLRGNPFRSRADAQRAVVDLFAPLVPAYEAGGARVQLSPLATPYDRAAVELEAFARPLWGVAPLAAGGGRFAHWDLFRQGLVEGTDPRHPRFWGALGDTDPEYAMANQRMVEMAAIGYALALVPEELFGPLSRGEQQRLLAWLEPINRHPLVENNWQFFRVLVNLGFARVGGPYDKTAVDECLQVIESHWLGDGWYSDGSFPGNTDLYIAWGYHFYGLVYAALATEADSDPAAGERFRHRAGRFAEDFAAWFDPSGRVVPFGRSLTYRFAAAALWGALGLAGEGTSLGWGQARGLWARHLRWWATQPTARPDGVLSVGWAYDNPHIAETYNLPGSAYWALKAFAPLALPDTHPFWATPEEAHEQTRQSVQAPARLVVTGDGQQAQILNGGRGHWFVRHGAAKYGKFAYSSAFGFAVDADDLYYQGISDSMLVLRDRDGVVRVRASVTDSGIDGDVVWSRWQPYPDVEVTTVLCGEAPWHARIHRLHTGRQLVAHEWGFAVGWDGEPADPPVVDVTRPGAALVRTALATSLIADPTGAREARSRTLQPNTHLMHPRALAPGVRVKLTEGTHTLVAVVAAVEPPRVLSVDDLPAVPDRAWTVLRALTEGPG